MQGCTALSQCRWAVALWSNLCSAQQNAEYPGEAAGFSLSEYRLAIRAGGSAAEWMHIRAPPCRLRSTQERERGGKKKRGREANGGIDLEEWMQARCITRTLLKLKMKWCRKPNSDEKWGWQPAPRERQLGIQTFPRAVDQESKVINAPLELGIQATHQCQAAKSAAAAFFFFFFCSTLIFSILLFVLLCLCESLSPLNALTPSLACDECRRPCASSVESAAASSSERVFWLPPRTEQVWETDCSRCRGARAKVSAVDGKLFHLLLRAPLLSQLCYCRVDKEWCEKCGCYLSLGRRL